MISVAVAPSVRKEEFAAVCVPAAVVCGRDRRG
jgi:hypothetical protein